jgi:hypothetical protein
MNLSKVLVSGCVLVTAAFVVVACGSSDGSEFGDPNGNGSLLDGSFGDGGLPDGGDPYANDPPPKWCGPADQPEPPKPTGTEQCPSDKNKPGCGCDNVGEEAPCWTGFRVNRNLGICKDGVATCEQVSETNRVWSDCVGQVLPAPGATKGPQACKCFSEGQWKIDNLSPCFMEWCSQTEPDPDNPGSERCVQSSVTARTAVSTEMVPGGASKCPAQSQQPPQPKPTVIWSTNSLKVDCAGHFKLCYELKAGNFEDPKATDCSLTKVCTEADYLKENVEQPFPDLAGWVSQDRACIEKWEASGGYGEMTVVGESVLCDQVGDGSGGSYVFNRVKYCPSKCRGGANAEDPECKNCQQGGSGTFE